MNRIVFSLVFLVCVVFANAQTEKKIYYDRNWRVIKNNDSAAYYRIVSFDDRGNPVGVVKDFYYTDALEAIHEGAIKIDSVSDHNTIFTGENKLFYKSGKKELIAKRDNKGVLLSEEAFYENGSLWFSATIKGGKKNGLMKFLDEDGNKISEVNYLNDTMDGARKDYYGGGMLHEESFYVHGKKEGVFKSYDEAGRIKVEAIYRNNLKNGITKIYDLSGKLMFEQNYVNDLLDGVVKRYYRSGVLNSESNYVNGIQQGVTKNYYSDGHMESQWPYINGKINGAVTLYWHNGNEKEIVNYNGGIKGDCTCADSIGGTIDCKMFEKDTLKKTLYPLAKGIDTTKGAVYAITEKMPQAPFDINEYLSSNIKYPEYERAKGIIGTVFINFIVEDDGTVDDVQVLKGASNGLNLEAVRVIESMPKWQPGYLNDHPVRVSYNIPIRFVLN